MPCNFVSTTRFPLSQVLFAPLETVIPCAPAVSCELLFASALSGAHATRTRVFLQGRLDTLLQQFKVSPRATVQVVIGMLRYSSAIKPAARLAAARQLLPWLLHVSAVEMYDQVCAGHTCVSFDSEVQMSKFARIALRV